MRNERIPLARQILCYIRDFGEGRSQDAVRPQGTSVYIELSSRRRKRHCPTRTIFCGIMEVTGRKGPGMDTKHDELNEDILRRDEETRPDLEELRRWIMEDVRSGYGDTARPN